MDTNPRRGKGRGRGTSAQNNMQGSSQRFPPPMRPPGSRPQQPVIRPQPQRGPNENLPRVQPPQLPVQSASSKEVQELASGINKLAVVTGNETVPLGRGSARGRPEFERMPLVRPQSSIATKEGSYGNPITLVSNYFPITSYTNWTLYQYRVDFNPEIEHPLIKRGLMQVHSVKLGPNIFDGTVLYSSTKYESEKFELVSKQIHDDQIVIINLSYVGYVPKNDPANIQVFNLLLRNCTRHLDLKLVGRNFYDDKAKIVINQHQLQIWPGYETTIGLFDSGLMLRAEISTKIMRSETVLHYLQECMKNKDGLNTFKRGVIGTVVLTAYNNQTYKINDVDENANVTSTFLKKDGTKMSYAQYYKERWNLTVKSPKQPMLMSKKKKKNFGSPATEEIIYLIPEFCTLTGLTDSMRNNFYLMKDLAAYTQIDPKGRVERYTNFMKRLQTTPKCLDIFNTWNMKLGSKLVELSGRVLLPENIQPNAICKKSYSAGIQADWTNHLRDLPMFTCAQLKQWSCLYPSSLNDNIVRNFITNIQQVAKKMSFMLPIPNLVPVSNHQVHSYVAVLESICNQYNPPLILCVLAGNRQDFYIAIKKFLCVQRAVPSQVVISKNVEKNNKSVCTKVAIQMNAKLGGAPWFISIPAKGMMIVGFDVCHDKKREISYGALIATLNDSHTSYYSTVQIHSSGEEISNHFGALVISAANKYREKNKQLPSSIVIYRDGVGDGQLSHVQTTEIGALKRLYQKFFNVELSSLAFIVVKKRIGTRFFSKTTQGLANPPPGTVIDKIVTDPNMYDFYLVSQNTRFGTVTPTHYNVLEDTLKNWSPDKMQRLTFKLTHMYYNWSGTVRVPAPCQLAHKLAFLAAQVGVPNAGLDELLYYL